MLKELIGQKKVYKIVVLILHLLLQLLYHTIQNGVDSMKLKDVIQNLSEK